MTPTILELSGNSPRYIYTDEGFTMFILSEPINSKHKGRILWDINHNKDINYNEKRYILLDDRDTLLIKRASNITYFGQFNYMTRDKSIGLIGADERKDAELEKDFEFKTKDIVSCKTEINTTYVVIKNDAKTGFPYIRTNINNVTLK